MTFIVATCAIFNPNMHFAIYKQYQKNFTSHFPVLSSLWKNGPTQFRFAVLVFFIICHSHL